MKIIMNYQPLNSNKAPTEGHTIVGTSYVINILAPMATDKGVLSHVSSTLTPIADDGETSKRMNIDKPYVADILEPTVVNRAITKKRNQH